MQAVDAIRLGIMSVVPRAECVGVPMADGGEGTGSAALAGVTAGTCQRIGSLNCQNKWS